MPRIRDEDEFALRAKTSTEPPEKEIKTEASDDAVITTAATIKDDNIVIVKTEDPAGNAIKVEALDDGDIKVESVELRDPALTPYTPSLPVGYKEELLSDIAMDPQPSTSTRPNNLSDGRRTVRLKLPVKQIIAPSANQFIGTGCRGGRMYQPEDGFRESATLRRVQPGRPAFPILWNAQPSRPLEGAARNQADIGVTTASRREARQSASHADVNFPSSGTMSDRAAWKALSAEQKEKMRSDAIDRANKMRRAVEDARDRPLGGGGKIGDAGKEKKKASNEVPPAASGGCFVCNLVRTHNGKARSWQCDECVRKGRALTPMNEEELEEEKSRKRKVEETRTSRNRSSSYEEGEGGEQEIRRSGRVRKAPKKFE